MTFALCSVCEERPARDGLDVCFVCFAASATEAAAEIACACPARHVAARAVWSRGPLVFRSEGNAIPHHPAGCGVVSAPAILAAARAATAGV